MGGSRGTEYLTLAPEAGALVLTWIDTFNLPRAGYALLNFQMRETEKGWVTQLVRCPI